MNYMCPEDKLNISFGHYSVDNILLDNLYIYLSPFDSAIFPFGKIYMKCLYLRLYYYLPFLQDKEYLMVVLVDLDNNQSALWYIRMCLH